MKRVFFLLLITLSIASCGKNPEQTKSPIHDSVAASITQVLYFHGKQRCITCNAIESLSKEVVDSLSSDSIVMKIIDISLTENEPLADKYEVAWSSLIIERNGRSTNLTDMAFSYAKDSPDQFKALLREELSKTAK